MKDLFIILHQRGESPIQYYSSFQNNIGDILAETDEFETPEAAEQAAKELLGMLIKAQPYVCAGYYYYALVVNGQILLRTRSSDTERGAKVIYNELRDCAKGEVIHYAHLKEKETYTIHHDPKVMDYMYSLDGMGQKNLLNYTTDVQWENTESWLWDKEKGEMGGLYGRLFHRMPRRHGAEYTVTIRTGFEDNAGTDAQVYLTLYGKRAELTGAYTDTVSEEFKLACKVTDFDPMGEDVFHISAKENLGELQRIRIRHDNADHGRYDASWHLMDVTVQKDGTKHQWVFPCNQWLQVTEEGTRNDVTLSVAATNYHQDIYYVEVITGRNTIMEGQDSNIYLTFYGTKGKSGEYKLGTTLRTLEKKGEGVRLYMRSDLGVLEKVLVRLDNPKACPEWCLREILVDNLSGGGSWWFPFDRVLPADKIDQEKGLQYMLVAGPYEDDEIVYAVRVQTGYALNSGTAARVYITLHGTRGSSQEYKLKSPDNDFQTGQLDTYRISMKEDIGDLKQIRIRHDNFGLWPSWYLEKVDVEKLDSDDRWQFPCGRWLAKRKEDGKIDRTLDAVLPGREPFQYRISVRTGDLPKAGTLANVRISLYGSEGTLEDYELNELGFDFLRGETSSFLICMAKELGDIGKIRIRHDNSGLFSGWYLEDVTVTRTGGDMEDKKWYFICGQWLARKEGDGLMDRTLDVVPGRTGPMVYEISVKTGDGRRAGTNADVYITLNGTNGSSEEYLLGDKGNDFRKGKTDTFIVQGATDLGELTSVRIRHDGSGLFPGWYLEDIRIKIRDVGLSWYFPCGKWLDEKQEDGLTERVLEAVPDPERNEEGGMEG